MTFYIFETSVFFEHSIFFISFFFFWQDYPSFFRQDLFYDFTIYTFIGCHFCIFFNLCHLSHVIMRISCKCRTFCAYLTHQLSFWSVTSFFDFSFPSFAFFFIIMSFFFFSTSFFLLTSFSHFVLAFNIFTPLFSYVSFHPIDILHI